MFSKVKSCAVHGVDGRMIDVEADVNDGLPVFTMVGYLSSSVRESSERVRTALKNSGFHLPPKRITINLSPADMRKDGSGYDLAIATAVLLSLGVTAELPMEQTLVLGELSLDGSIKAIPGVLPMVICAREEGMTSCIVPKENVQEAALVQGISVIGVSSLKETMEYIQGIKEYENTNVEQPAVDTSEYLYDIDFSDVVGQESINYYNQSVAIVGARNADTYCKETTRIFARELAKAGIQIVSGLARGIDGQAHRGCLEAGGYTIAVLGCGINVTYPRENIELFAQIEERGLILSEYCLDVPPLAFQFPLRNRIISGLSDGVLVSCAKKKSGSLITADLALDQGKQVYALPGRVLDAFSEGTNHLIQMGAMCVTRPKDILLDLWGEERLNMDDVSGAASGSAEKQSETRDNLTTAERTVYDLLGLDPVHVDDVIAQARLGVSTTISVLYELERRNVIKQPVRGYYIWSL